VTGDAATRPRSAVGVSSAFGTFGELLQGVLPDGRDFLVTFPIARWSTAVYRSDPRPGPVRVIPDRKHKARRVAEHLLAAFELPGSGELRVDSCLPEGKGLASSSADLVATARAIGNALDLTVSPTMIEDLLRRIEPSDGVMYPGVVAFHHREVRLRANLGSLPALTVVGLDEGDTVDTVAFNLIPKPFGTAERREYEALLSAMASAVAAGDAAQVGRVSTRSAEMNQKLRPKHTLDHVGRACRRFGGLGVVVAHSGTSIGILFADDSPDYPRQIAAARRFCHGLAGNASVYHSLVFEERSGIAPHK
jgi:L-threonine kinase